MKRIGICLTGLFLLSFSCLFAKDEKQDFSQTKISWDGPPEYEIELIECEGSTYTSIVYLKFAVTHNLAHQYLHIEGNMAYDKAGNEYYVTLYGYKSSLGSSFFSNIDRIIKTNTRSIINVKVDTKRKIDKFDTLKLGIRVNKPYYSRDSYNLEFINLPIEWKFINF